MSGFVFAVGSGLGFFHHRCWYLWPSTRCLAKALRTTWEPIWAGASITTELGINSRATVAGNYADATVTGEDYSLNTAIQDGLMSGLKTISSNPELHPAINDYGDPIISMGDHIFRQEALQDNGQ